MDGQVLHHVVLIKVRPDAPEEMKEDIFQRYQRLWAECGGEDAGILYFALKPNKDLRKGITWVEFALFKSDEAFQAFRAHPAHKAITDRLSQIADWFVGDYNAPPPIMVIELG